MASITDGRAIDDPILLFQFAMLTFADLKSYKFTYWYCEPTLVPDEPFQTSPDGIRLFQDTNANQLVYLYKSLLEYWSTVSLGGTCKQVFMMLESTTRDSEPQIVSLRDGWSRRYDQSSCIVVFDSALFSSTSSSSSSSNISSNSSSSESKEQQQREATFGWTMRNVLALLALSHDSSTSSTPPLVNIASLRGPLWKKLLHAWTVGQNDGSWRAFVDGATPSDICKIYLDNLVHFSNIYILLIILFLPFLLLK